MIWFRGNYSSYTSYACEVVGLFTTAVPVPPEPPASSYLDATSGPGGNTVLADGSLFSPPLNGSTGADDQWEQRTVFGSSGNIFESGGETAEDAPELQTTITGLAPHAHYTIHVLFWDPTSTVEDWSIRAGFTSNPGANALYSAPDATGELGSTAALLASTLTYATAPTVFSESGRALLAASLGATTADMNGEIKVFIDDKPSTIGANHRTWYDGLAWAPVIAPDPVALAWSLSGTALSLSWPPSHLGWLLQSQTTSVGGGLASGWMDLGGSGSLTNTNVALIPGSAAVFFRLRRP